MYKYKKGDYVKIINNDAFDHHSPIKVGSIHRIADVEVSWHDHGNGDREFSYHIFLETEHPRSGRLIHVEDHQVELFLLKSDIVDFLQGDKVKVTRTMPNRAIAGTELRLVEYVRTDKISGEDVGVYVGIGGDGLRHEVYGHCLELIERPEKKYKKGDRVKILKDSDEHGFPIGSIQTITEMGRIHTTNGKEHYCLYEVGQMTVRDSDFELASENPYEVSMKEFEELRDKAIKTNEPVITSIKVKKNHVEEPVQKRRRLLC
jgi:ribosomal protein L21E